jgi:hypothetical protein
MKKFLYPLGILTTTLGLFGALAAPAQATVHNANYGNRGSAWTNTAHTRVGVQDNRADGVAIYVDAYTALGTRLFAKDENDSDPGHSAYPSPDGSRFVAFRVCGWHTAEQRWGCGNLVEI